MAIKFEVTSEEAILDLRKFCQLKDELTYVGRFASKKTSEVIPGTIIQYKGRFYTNELPDTASVSSSPADTKGMVTTSVELFETTKYIPEECKPLKDCPIRIDVWATNFDGERPVVSYAFYDEQLEEARNIVRSNGYVVIFYKSQKIGTKIFLEA